MCELTPNEFEAMFRRAQMVLSGMPEEGYRRMMRQKFIKAELRRKSTCCRYCGRKLSRTQQTLDHVVPLCRGGADELANLVLACQQCNTIKADRTPAEWAADILAVELELATA